MEEPKTEEGKMETAPDDTLLEEWATKIYKAADEVFIRLVELGHFENRDFSKKFMELMNGKKFGEFVEVSSEKNLLYIKVAGQDITGGEGYFPGRYHIKKIREFLAGYGKKWTDIAQKIIMWIADIIIAAHTIRRNVLYPEIAEAEEEIKRLKQMLKETENQLRVSLDTWSYMAQEIDSSLRRANTLFFSTLNKLNSINKPE